jgi:GAF domain-containing protein/HAMP domain-containing protein
MPRFIAQKSKKMKFIRFFTTSIRRKILFSFIVVIVLVLILVAGTYTQLGLVRDLSRQVTPSSTTLTALQDYALAVSDFESNLDRYFVIGGPQFQEAMREDVNRMNDALEVVGTNIGSEFEPTFNQLRDTTTQLDSEITTLLQVESTGLSTREANERIISLFSVLETARQQQQELTELTSVQLQGSALNQETLISSVIIQTLIFAGIVLLMVVAASVIVTRSIARPLVELTEAARQVEQGDLEVEVSVKTEDEVGQLAQTFNSMASQLHSVLGTLEQQVEERTRGLSIVAAINERLTGILNIDQLLDEVVHQVKDNFNYYHVHIYLLNQSQDRLVVAAGTGQAGAAMKANEHSIDINAKSLVARAARSANIVTIANVHQEEDWLPNALLPNTNSEVAVPVILTGQVVGVLDVQEDKINAFDTASFDLLRSVADQVALGIRNAQQFEQVQSTLAELQDVQQQYLEQSWDKVALSRFTSAQAEVQLADKPVETTSSFTTPIEFRQTSIGSLELEDVNPQRVWSDDELALINAVTDQVAQSAENLRLFEEARELAGREQTIREITDKLRSAPNLDTLLETAARELGLRLGARHTVLEMGIETETNINTNGSDGHEPVETGQQE